jgi:hypothetical protein
MRHKSAHPACKGARFSLYNASELPVENTIIIDERAQHVFALVIRRVITIHRRVCLGRFAATGFRTGDSLTLGRRLRPLPNDACGVDVRIAFDSTLDASEPFALT